MAHLLRLTLILGLAAVFAGCASTTTARTASTATRSRIHQVRTTAYTHNEGGSGGHNALGKRLSGGQVKSAAADWSRFPVGTRFRVVRTGDEYIVDDYGGALVGTSTIDLYKNSRSAMHRWGVRHEEIEIIHWGSEAESLEILRKRKGVRRIRQMIASLEKKQQELPSAAPGS
jgi:3D (Asp-Asp-Asp) domain-containing protein